MPIPLSCHCGRNLNIADHHAGKRIKCPSCGAALPVPGPGDEPAEWDFEVVEDDEPPTVNPVQPAAEDPKGDNKKRGPKGRQRSGRGGGVARMYLEQAEAEMRRDEVRARAAG